MLLCENSGQNDTKFNNNWATILDDCSDFDLVKKPQNKTKDTQKIYNTTTPLNNKYSKRYKSYKIVKKYKLRERLIS